MCRNAKLWFSGFFGALTVAGLVESAAGTWTLQGPGFTVTISPTIAIGVAVVSALVSFGFYYSYKKGQKKRISKKSRRKR